MWRANSLEKTLMLGKIEGKRRRRKQSMRWLNNITDSAAWIWANSRRQWRREEPGGLQPMESQRVTKHHHQRCLLVLYANCSRSGPPIVLNCLKTCLNVKFIITELWAAKLELWQTYDWIRVMKLSADMSIVFPISDSWKAWRMSYCTFITL